MDAQIDSILEAGADKAEAPSSLGVAAGRRSNRVSLLLRLWQEGGEGRHELLPVRALVRNLQSGEESYVDGMDNVLSFVSAAWAGEHPSDNGEASKEGDSNEV